MYGTKFNLDFYTIDRETLTLKIKKKGYAGSVNDISGGATPVVLNKPDQTDVLAPIIGTELRLQLMHKPDASYNLIDEFEDVSDREYQAVLTKQGEGDSYQATAKIDTFSLTNEAIAARAYAYMDDSFFLGDNKIKCFVGFDNVRLDSEPTRKLFAYAAPANTNGYSSAAIDLGYVIVRSEDTYIEIMDLFVAQYPNWKKDADITSPTYNKFYYEESNYTGPINNYYNIRFRFTYNTNSIEQDLTSYRFSGNNAVYIRFNWHTYRATGTPDVRTIAEHYLSTSDTVEDVAQSLVDQINGTEGYTLLENVYFPASENSGGEGNLYSDVKIKAVRYANQVRMYLLDIGTLGNEVRVLGSDINDTYLQITKDVESDYDLTFDAAFTGGTNGGDSFAFEVGDTIGTATPVASVIGTEDDTIASIVSKLVTAINNSQAIYRASVDETDSTRFNVVTTEDMSGKVYQFTTDGASTLQDSGPSWAQPNVEKILWIGYIIPQLNNISHMPGNQVITLSAVCGLGDLKNRTFEINEKRPFEKLSFITIITNVLKQTGLNLRLLEEFDLWEMNMISSISPLSQVYQDTSRLNGETSYTVISEIMTAIGCHIMQIEGQWVVRKLDRLGDSTHNYRVFDSAGAYIGNIENIEYIKAVGGANTNKFIGGQGSLMKEPAFRKVKVKHDFGYVGQLLKFPNFSNINENLKDANYNAAYPWRWILNDISQRSFLDKVQLDSDNFLRLDDISGQVYRYALSQKLKIGDFASQNLADKRQFELNVQFEGTSNLPVSITSPYVYVLVKITREGTTNYLYKEDEEDLSINPVTSNYTVIAINTREGEGIETFTQSFDYPFEGNTEADAEIQIFQPLVGYCRVKSAAIQVNAIVTAAENSEEYFIDEDSEGTKYVDRVTSEEYEKTIKLGDVPNLPAAVQIYKNSLFWVDDNQNIYITQDWSYDIDESDPTITSLVQHVRTLWLKAYGIPPYSLQRSVRGDVNVWDVVKDTTKDNNLFVCIQGQYDYRNKTLQGLWHETKLTEKSNFPINRQIDILQTQAESSGTNVSTGQPGGGSSSSQGIDLSNYYNKDEIDGFIKSVISSEQPVGGGSEEYEAVTKATNLVWDVANAATKNGVVTVTSNTDISTLQLTNMVEGGVYNLRIFWPTCTASGVGGGILLNNTETTIINNVYQEGADGSLFLVGKDWDTGKVNFNFKVYFVAIDLKFEYRSNILFVKGEAYIHQYFWNTNN